MGEYIRLDGVDGFYKLGTCESLYYARFSDLAEWVRSGRAHNGGDGDPAQYLGGDYRFRFPFPDEDGPEEDRLPRYFADGRPELYGERAFERGITFQVPPAFVPASDDHAEVCFYLGPRGVAHPGGVNVFVPCPQSAHFDAVAHSPLGDRRFLAVTQQRPIDGQLWTVCRCGFCHYQWRLPEEEAARLAEHITATRPEHAELARRIMAGYARTVDHGS